MKFFNLIIIMTLLILLLSACEVFTKIKESDWGESSTNGSSSEEEEKPDFIYVAGSLRNGSDLDYLIVKYDENGNFFWTITYDSGVSDIAYGVAVDSNSNLYVTGSRATDYLTIKYNPNGILEWQRIFNGSDDTAKGIVIDNNDNIYVSGYTDNFGNYTYYTIKYDQNGNIDTDVITDKVAARQIGHAIAIDNQRNYIYLTGEADRTLSFDYQTVKYNLNLNEITGESWPTWYPDPSNVDNDIANAIVVDNDGNVYVTGSSSNGGINDYLTIKYDRNGNLVTGELWPKYYDGIGDDDEANGIAVDADNNIYVTGYSRNGLNSDYYTIKYDSYGNELWARVYNNGSDDSAYAIDVDQQGYIYVTGESYNGINMDFLIIKYDSNGNTIWIQRYDSGDEDEAKDICIVNR